MKQSMKLYTEEQMHSVILLALVRHGIFISNNHFHDLIDLLDLLTPIELPSDEEIREERLLQFPDSEYANRANDISIFPNPSTPFPRQSIYG
jgi:hypothetical protein